MCFHYDFRDLKISEQGCFHVTFFQEKINNPVKIFEIKHLQHLADWFCYSLYTEIGILRLTFVS